jgi:hypothetical protein
LRAFFGASGKSRGQTGEERNSPPYPPRYAKKLTATERLVDEQMRTLLEWASERPGKWNPIGKMEATQKAAR